MRLSKTNRAIFAGTINPHRKCYYVAGNGSRGTQVNAKLTRFIHYTYTAYCYL